MNRDSALDDPVRRTLLLATAGAALVGCGGGGDSAGAVASAPAPAPAPPPASPPIPSNLPPTANAGLPQTVVAPATVSLSGSSSADANSDPLSFRWALLSKPVGSIAILSSATTVQTTFVVDEPGSYIAGLVVSDGKLDSARSSVDVTATASVAKQSTVVIRIVGTDPSFGQEPIPGWPNASPVKDAAGYSLYDLEIARDASHTPTALVLYKFKDWNASWFGVSPAEFAQYKGKSTLLALPISNAGGGTAFSTQVLAALGAAMDVVMQAERPTRVVIEYSGHGGPLTFLEGSLTVPDARLFVQGVRAKTYGAALILDFSTNCDVGYFDFAVNYHDIADYLIASEKLVGGFDPGDVTTWLKYRHDGNVHSFFDTANSSVAALDAIISARQSVWLNGSVSLKALGVEQSLAVYNLTEFSTLMRSVATIRSFDPLSEIPNHSWDLGTYIYAKGSAELVAAFERFRFRYASNRNIVNWKDDRRGFSVSNTQALKNYLGTL